MRPLSILVLLLVLSVPPTDAQVGRLLNRARAAVSGGADDARQAAADQARGAVDAAPRAAAGRPLPAVDFGDLLDTRFFPLRGDFLFDSPGAEFVYFAQTSDEVNGAYVVRRADGEIIGGQRIGQIGITGSNAIQQLNTRGGPEWSARMEDGGAYSLDVVVDGALWGSIPFTVEVRDNGDPYDPQTSYVLDGPWRTHAYFEHETDRPDYLMHFNAWVGTDDAPSNVPTEVSIRKEGREVAFGHGFTNTTYGWHRVEHRLFDVSGRDDRFGRHKTNADSWTIQDVTPGTYEIVLSHEGGEIRRYEIEAGSGAFVEHPRSAIDHEPRHRFLGTRRVTGQNLRDAHTLYWIGPAE